MKKILLLLNSLLLTACTNHGQIKNDNFKTNKGSYNDPDILFIQTENPFLDDKQVVQKLVNNQGYKKADGTIKKEKVNSSKSKTGSKK